MSDALARAGAGQRIDELLEEIAELQQSIEDSPAETLAFRWTLELILCAQLERARAEHGPATHRIVNCGTFRGLCPSNVAGG